MPNQKNITEVNKLEEKIGSSQAVFIAEYQKLDSAAQADLRAKVIAAGGELQVTKNTLLKIAAKNHGIDVDKVSNEFEGPTITLFATNDAVAPLKAVVDFAKNMESEMPRVKVGFLNKEILTVEKVKQLANLPSKLELLGKLIGQIQAPVYGMVNILAAPTRNLVYALNAIKEKKNTQ